MVTNYRGIFYAVAMRLSRILNNIARDCTGKINF